MVNNNAWKGFRWQNIRMNPNQINAKEVFESFLFDIKIVPEKYLCEWQEFIIKNSQIFKTRQR